MDVESEDLKEVLGRRGGWFKAMVYEGKLVIDLSKLVKGLRIIIVFNHRLLQRNKMVNTKAYIHAKHNGLTIRFKDRMVMEIFEDVVKK